MANHSQALQQAASLIRHADGLIIAAGAGMGVDSGLPDFRGQQGFWRAYPALAKAGIDFTEIANPAAFANNPRQAWGFYGHRLNLYRQTQPHHGFQLLHNWANRKPGGYAVFTSNVDGHFQKAGFSEDYIYECHGSIHFLQCSQPCNEQILSVGSLHIETDDENCLATSDLPRCNLCLEVMRPNILMFGDWQWVDTRAVQQQRQFSQAIAQMQQPVIIELGAGLAVPTVRHFCESSGAPLIRINPRDWQRPPYVEGVSLPMGALEALTAIDALL